MICKLSSKILCLALMWPIVTLAQETEPAAEQAAKPAAAKAKAPAPKLFPGAPAVSATCTPCHAEDGNTDNPAFAKLSGLSPAYIVKQLDDFKQGATGKRNNPVMQTVVSTLTTQDIEDLANFYSKQPRTINEAANSNIELGERIYRAGNLKTGVTPCAACHLINGYGNELAGFPKLAGQNAQYITSQLQAFKAGTRSNDLNNIMQDIAAKLSDQEIEAVSNYVSGLH